MIRVLVICGDYWHPAEVVKQGLCSLPDAARFAFTFVKDAKDMLTPAMLCDYDVVISAKMNELSENNRNVWFEDGVTELMPAHLLTWVKQGHGFIGLHGGLSHFPQDENGYLDLIGCYFVQHPPRCEIAMKVEKAHPVTEGVADFTYRDEHYELATVCDDMDVLCTTHSESGGHQLGVAVRTLGEGRACMLAPGHILESYLNPQFQRLLSNAIAWCAHS